VQHLLSYRDEDVDRQYVSSLDGDMRLRRWVYEMMLATKCSSLNVVDGGTEDTCVISRVGYPVALVRSSQEKVYYRDDFRPH